MFWLSGFIQFDGIGEKPRAEHHDQNSRLNTVLAALQTSTHSKYDNCSDQKISDRQTRANRVDPDQSAASWAV